MYVILGASALRVSHHRMRTGRGGVLFFGRDFCRVVAGWLGMGGSGRAWFHRGGCRCGCRASGSARSCWPWASWRCSSGVR